MPGPLFNFSSYLGAVYKGVAGGMVAYVGLFGPGVILIFGMVSNMVLHKSYFSNKLVIYSKTNAQT